MTDRPSRAQRLRARDRRVFAWSLGAAVVVHVLAVLLFPGFRTKDWSGSDIELGGDPDDGVRSHVRVVFGPPLIFDAAGGAWREPPDRFLQADRAVRLPVLCTELARTEGQAFVGTVRLRVDPAGYAGEVEVVQGTGDRCADHVMIRVADALRYHWLPTARFPAPVSLEQPVRIVDVDA